jgi:hypothetical protein
LVDPHDRDPEWRTVTTPDTPHLLAACFRGTDGTDVLYVDDTFALWLYDVSAGVRSIMCDINPVTADDGDDFTVQCCVYNHHTDRAVVTGSVLGTWGFAYVYNNIGNDHFTECVLRFDEQPPFLNAVLNCTSEHHLSLLSNTRLRRVDLNTEQELGGWAVPTGFRNRWCAEMNDNCMQVSATNGSNTGLVYTIDFRVPLEMQSSWTVLEPGIDRRPFRVACSPGGGLLTTCGGYLSDQRVNGAFVQFTIDGMLHSAFRPGSSPTAIAQVTSDPHIPWVRGSLGPWVRGPCTVYMADVDRADLGGAFCHDMCATNRLRPSGMQDGYFCEFSRDGSALLAGTDHDLRVVRDLAAEVGVRMPSSLQLRTRGDDSPATSATSLSDLG